MSLIHQVLKDLDGRPAPQAGDVAGYADEAHPQRLVIWPAIVVSMLSAAAVIYFSEYLNDSGPLITTSSLPVIPSAELSLPSPEYPLSEQVVVSTASAIETTDLPELLRVVPSEAEVEVSDVDLLFSESEQTSDATEIKNNSISSVSTTNVSVTLPAETNKEITKEAVEPVAAPILKKKAIIPAVATVTRRTSAEEYYVKAVAYYRNGDWQSSLAELAHATKTSSTTNTNGAIEYQAMKARIFLEQGMRDQFVAVFRSNSDNRNVSWLSVIAPGLHLFGLYDDAVQQYNVLSLIQPKNVEWPIAKTQALIDAGMVTQALTELKYMKENYPLNEQQLNWLRYQQRILE